MTAPPESDPRIAAFIARWHGISLQPGLTELATAQSFVNELCAVLGVDGPHHAADYQFERAITFVHGNGQTSPGRIDCYKRGHFVIEAKRLRAAAVSRGFDDALLRARSQAETYARALPADEGRPPFLLVVDVGHVIEVYAEFTRSGATYTPFPDPRSHRIRLADLAQAEVRDTLRAIWTDPLSLDPAKRAARVTREIAAQLAQVAKALEAAGHAPTRVAAFLSRCLFTMFAEDIGLLPKRAFADLLERYTLKPDVLARQLEILWQNMDRGEFSPLLETTLLKFNGKLFKQPEALPLAREQIGLLLAAARADWKQVEPAIFGTLLERALDPDERHALGAHYTPRAYVERLVLPTIIEPLRQDWQHVQAAALVLIGDANVGNSKAADEARRLVREYLMRLCEVRVLDPACGSGNFLYVALEQMKRLEGEVLNFLDSLGDTQGRLDLAGVSVDPHQLLGIELNPRAAEVAEMVLWIGYLQWHYRTRGNVNPPLPVLKDFHNIECRDAVLAYDRIEFQVDADGKPVTRWDGKTMKRHPVTGLPVPDERAQVPVEKYINPRAAEWPVADFIVGNPPFIGASTVRRALGDGYADALRATWPAVPESADFVMHWWQMAATKVASGAVRQFGLIATNSISQTFNRRVIAAALQSSQPIHFAYAVPDHPWVDSADGAAVRISMTVGRRGDGHGLLERVVSESSFADGSVEVTTARLVGDIQADLRIGANLIGTSPLQSNRWVANRGVQLLADGFIVDADELAALGMPNLARPYRNAKDITDRARGLQVLDTFGLDEGSLRERFPSVWQRLALMAKPGRDVDKREVYRLKWWLFGENQPLMRAAVARLNRYIATPITAKHRLFTFLPAAVLADQALVSIACDSPVVLGVLSSRLHLAWTLANGGTLEDRPRYNKTRCFETFAFPIANDQLSAHVAELAEQFDAHRKRVQSQHPDLTLTGLYNVLEKLRRGEPLSAKEKTIHDHGLVSVLRDLHDDLDRAVFAAYGWDDLAALLVGKPGATTPWPEKPAEQAAAEEELLSRLVALNAERAAEEARGLVRWLRPEFQAGAAAGDAAAQTEIDTGTADTDTDTDAPADITTPTAPRPAGKRAPWPATLPEQIRLVADTVSQAARPLDLDQLAEHFTGRGPWKKRLPDIVDSLAALGRVKLERSGERVVLHG